MEGEKPKLLITGVTGYVGSWVAKTVLETKQYAVYGTVRDPTKTDKLADLKAGLGEIYNDMTLVQADMLEKDTVDKAIEGCQYVIHVASPFVLQMPDDEDTIVKPAVEGTENVLNACLKHGVSRLVFTSSSVTIEDFEFGNQENVDETCIAKLHDHEHPYGKSKILAEQKVREFMEEHKNDKNKVEVVILNPGFVVGPLLTKSGGVSETLVSQIMNGTCPTLPFYYSMCVDIRDVATAHLKGLTCTPGERYAIVESNHTFQDIAAILQEEFEGKKINPKVDIAPKCMIWLASFFSAEANHAYARLELKVDISNKKATEKLGMTFIPFRQSLKEMGESLMKHGLVKENE